MYAVCLGTNSFSFPLPERMTLSLVVFGRTGLYEIAALTLVSVPTYSINLYEVTRFIPATYTTLTPKPKFSLMLEQWIVFGLAIVILLAANTREAYMILAL